MSQVKLIMDDDRTVAAYISLQRQPGHLALRRLTCGYVELNIKTENDDLTVEVKPSLLGFALAQLGEHDTLEEAQDNVADLMDLVIE